jgi:hypothetical protein
MYNEQLMNRQQTLAEERTGITTLQHIYCVGCTVGDSHNHMLQAVAAKQPSTAARRQPIEELQPQITWLKSRVEQQKMYARACAGRLAGL